MNMPSNSMNGSQAVAANLDHADKVQNLHGDVNAVTEVAGGPEEHGADPSIGGVLDATVIVSIAMAVFIMILIAKKVPAAIGKALDGRIDAIKAQLDEASKLRAEAEELKREYQAKLAGAEQEAANLRGRAEEEAAVLMADAKTEAAALVTRRQKMAEDKIAAAERSAIAEIRAKAVTAATSAAGVLIAENHDAKADKVVVDAAIQSLSTVN